MAKKVLTSYMDVLKGKVQEKGAKFNGYLDTFLSLCLKTAKNDDAVLNIIEDYVNNGIIPMTEKDFSGFEEERFVALNKSSLAVHYRYDFKLTTVGAPLQSALDLTVLDYKPRI